MTHIFLNFNLSIFRHLQEIFIKFNMIFNNLFIEIFHVEFKNKFSKFHF